VTRACVTGQKLGIVRYPLADAPAAYAAMRSGEITKAIIKFQGG